MSIYVKGWWADSYPALNGIDPVVELGWRQWFRCTVVVDLAAKTTHVMVWAFGAIRFSSVQQFQGQSK